MKKIYLGIILILSTVISFAQTNTFIGASGGAWATGGNWSLGIPTSAHDVVIPAGKTVPTASGLKTVNSLTIQNIPESSDTSTEEIFDEFDEPTGEFDTIITVTPAVYGKIDMNSSSAKLRIITNLIMDGELTMSNASSTDAIKVEGNVIINSGKTLTILVGKAMNVIGDFTITDLTSFTNNGTLNIDGNLDLGSESISLGSNSITTVAGTISNYSNLTPSNGTFIYDGTSNQTVIPKNYNNLTFSGAGKKTINGAITVAGTFTPGSNEVEYNFASTTTILPAAYGTLTFTGGGEKQIAGTVTASIFNIGTGKVTYSGVSQTILPAAYPNLALDGSGTHIIPDWVSASTFTNSVSSVSYTSEFAQNILPGAYAANLTLSGVGKKTFTDITTIAGTFTPSADVEYNSSSDLNVKAGTYTTLRFEGSGLKTVPAGVNYTTLAIGTNQSVNYNGADQVIADAAYNALTLNTSGTKTIAGAVSATTFNATGATVSYTGASAQTVIPANYGVLNFSGAGQKNISSVAAVIINANAATIAITGTLVVTTFNQGTSTVDYALSGDQSIMSSIGYYNLAVSGSGNKTIGSALSVHNITTSGTAILVTGTNNITVSGDLTNGASFTKTSGDLAITGNLVNNGTLSLGDGVLKFNGATATALSGSAAVTAKFVEVAKSNTLTLSNTLNISPLGSLTITNGTTTVAAGGNLRLKSDITGYSIVPAIPSGSSITGTTTVEAYIPATIRTWWHLTNPVASPAVSTWQDNFPVTGAFTGFTPISGSVNGTSLYYYDETNTNASADIGWVKYPAASNSETMARGVGYRAYIRDNATTASPKTLDVPGVLNQGNIAINLKYTNTGNAGSDGWNFIGNPYPATLAWSNLTSDTDLSDANAYVWNAISKTYAVSGTGIKIAPFQAFWVQANNAGDGQLNLTESMKSTGGTLQRPTLVENKININLIDKNVDNSYNNSSASLVIHPEATTGFDRAFEASYLSRNFTSTFGDAILSDVATTTVDGRKLKVNYVPESENVQTVPLYVVFATSTEYSLNLSTEEFSYVGDLVLVDSYLGSETIFSDALNYDFKTTADAASKKSDRFAIKVGAKPVGLFDGQSSSESNIELYPNPTEGKISLKVKSIYSDFEISIVDMVGTEVYNEYVVNSSSSVSKDISLASLNAGVYFVKVTHKGNTFTEKVIVNKH